MKGTLYGVGVGPGDPELITVKAVRIIRQCPVLALPGKHGRETIAYQIASQAVEGLEEKELLPIHLPMTRDQKALSQCQKQGAEQIIRQLEQGRDVAFLTIGDPSIYSTYIYLQKLVKEQGYAGEMISGVPSFCAAAARLGESLAEQEEPIHILPVYSTPEEALSLPGTKILMKAGKQLDLLRERLVERGIEASLVENCGMESERIYQGTSAIPKESGYLSLLIASDRTK